MTYRERLWPGVGVWLFAALMVGSLAVAVAAAAPGPAGPVAGAVVGAFITWLLVVASPRVHLDERVLRADRARLPWQHVGTVTVLTEDDFRAATGPQAHAGAYLMLRPWVRTGVRVDVQDPRDPHPYWIIGSHRPVRLARAIESARAAVTG